MAPLLQGQVLKKAGDVFVLCRYCLTVCLSWMHNLQCLVSGPGRLPRTSNLWFGRVSWGGLAGWVGLCGVNATSCGGGRSQCFPRLGWGRWRGHSKGGGRSHCFPRLGWGRWGRHSKVLGTHTKSKAGGRWKWIRFGEQMGEDGGGGGGGGLSEGQWEGRQGAWGWASKRHAGSKAGRRADRDAGRELVSCITN